MIGITNPESFQGGGKKRDCLIWSSVESQMHRGIWSAEKRALLLRASSHRPQESPLVYRASNSDPWNAVYIYSGQGNRRSVHRRESHITLRGFSEQKVVRGILRGVLRRIDGWGAFRKCVIDSVRARMVSHGIAERSRAFERHLNQKQAFGAADTLQDEIGGELVGDRWAMDFQDCTRATRSDAKKAWAEVQDKIETVLLPSLTELRDRLSKRVDDVQEFEGTRLRPNDEYVCIRKGVLVDPVHSSAQNPHMDIVNPELDKIVGPYNIWNIFLPIRLREGHPETAVEGDTGLLSDSNPGTEDVVFFEGRNRHFGRGNPMALNQPRILIHMAFVQKKLLQVPLGREEIRQQYQPGGLYKDEKGNTRSAPFDETSIFDPGTLVGANVKEDLERMGIEPSPWERKGGLGIELGNKTLPPQYKKDLRPEEYYETAKRQRR